jgi:hypothetical protein
MEPPSRRCGTQNGWELNMVNDAGLASRAWFDYPGRISRRHDHSIRQRDGLAAGAGATAGPAAASPLTRIAAGRSSVASRAKL